MYFAKVRFIPKRKQRKRTQRKDVVSYLDTFMAMNCKYARLEFDADEYVNTNSACGSLYSTVHRYGYPIVVKQRDDDVYLERTDI